MNSAYNPYSVHANRGLGAWQRKQGANVSTFQWNNGVWVCSPNVEDLKQTLTTGGQDEDYFIRFSCLASQFIPAMAKTADGIRQLMLQNGGTTFQYLGATYKFTKVEIAPIGLVLTCEGNSQFQNG